MRRSIKHLFNTLRPDRLVTSLPTWSGDAIRLTKGAATYYKTGFTPDSAYQSLINLHCRTQGYSNDFLSWFLEVCRPPSALPNADGILGNLTPHDIDRITGEIRENGYYIFSNLLADDICERLRDFALTAECAPFPRRESAPERTSYNRDQPIAENYRFAEQTLLDNPDIQKLLSDHSILAVAQAYVKTSPILDIVAMWWSTAFGTTASSQAAQLYHFDMDRIKWLKFFFYLTDVTPKNGPHCYVAKSHKRKGQPRHLLSRGYARIPDKEIELFYGADDIKEITGPRGTIFVADTRGFHKGKLPESSDRLVLQFEFCNNLFGGAYTKSRLRNDYDPHLLELATRYRRIFSKFEVNGA